ncbi:bis-aminopropyl spermidine synthase family protein [Virgibacillus salexigens]|nr:bis-aminopropyl spermidine synthase family protein [Virgibacillus massiliensis]
MMIKVIEQVNGNLDLEEGSLVIEHLMIECFLTPGISTKILARKVLLPVPVTVAIKKELIENGLLKQDRGVRCTQKGKALVEQSLDYKGLDKQLHERLLSRPDNLEADLDSILIILHDLFSKRPQVNVQLDQSLCTPETSLRRAILCLSERSLIGKRILCVGDDDLVSVAIGLLLQKLFPRKSEFHTWIDVMDIDTRFLAFINKIAKEKNLPITCIEHDMRKPVASAYVSRYDCFLTDPPYTLQGMELFVSRGVHALKRQSGMPIFLSFAHKSPAFMLKMQQIFIRLGLSVTATLPQFDHYLGAQMIANQSQMLIMKTTTSTEIPIDLLQEYQDPIYTGEMKQSFRIYRCKSCGIERKVGANFPFKTIEQLKESTCPVCCNNTFLLIKKRTGNK